MSIILGNIKNKYFYNKKFNKTNKQKIKKDFIIDPRIKNDSKNDKIKSAIGSAIGTGIGLLYLTSKKNIKNPFKIDYNLTDMLALSFSAIAGGVGVSLIGNDRKTKINKIKEGVFQFANASIPAWLAASTLKLCETSKNHNNLVSKALSTVGAILVGMHGASSLANLICDYKDKEPDRKLTLKDSIANLDDLVGVLALAKFPIIKNLPIESILPFIYGYCGYKAGNGNKSLYEKDKNSDII